MFRAIALLVALQPLPAFHKGYIYWMGLENILKS